MAESGRVPGKGRIRASIQKLSRRVPGKGRIRVGIKKIVSANTEKVSNECEYRKMVESRRVPGKGRINVNIKKRS